MGIFITPLPSPIVTALQRLEKASRNVARFVVSGRGGISAMSFDRTAMPRPCHHHEPLPNVRSPRPTPNTRPEGHDQRCHAAKAQVN